MKFTLVFRVCCLVVLVSVQSAGKGGKEQEKTPQRNVKRGI